MARILKFPATKIKKYQHHWQRRAGIILAFLLPFYWGCGSRPESSPPAAQVGNRTITQEALIERYGLNQDRISKTDEIDAALLEEAARKWALEEILIQEAQKRDLDQDRLFLVRMDNLRRDILIGLLYENATTFVTVDSVEIQQEYNGNRAEYTISSDQVDLLYILAPTRDLADQARRGLLEESDLEEILTTNDQLSGVEIGWVSKEDLDPAIATAAFSITPGGTSYPLKYNTSGYIVMKCRQRRQAGTTLPLQEVETKIRQRILLREKLQTEKALRDSLWFAYNPQIFAGAGQ